MVEHICLEQFARKLTCTWQNNIHNSDTYIKQELCLARAAWKTHKAEIVLARSRMYEGLLLASIMHKRVQDAISQSSREGGRIQQLRADLRNRGITDEVNTRAVGPEDLHDLLVDAEGQDFMRALDMAWIGGDEWSECDGNCTEDQCDNPSSWTRRGEGSMPN
jgi:hypothetical protein